MSQRRKKKNFTVEDIHALLESSLQWPTELLPNTPYDRVHDDHDGTNEGKIIVGATEDGDVWLTTDQPTYRALRFRTPFGGGSSPCVRNALVILMLAIKKENEKKKLAR